MKKKKKKSDTRGKKSARKINVDRYDKINVIEGVRNGTKTAI